MCCCFVTGSAISILSLEQLSTHARQRLEYEQRRHSLDYLATTFCQLEDITGIIARYAVMENLYRQTRGISLQSDYKAALIRLCCKILSWFDWAFLICEYDHPRGITTCRELWISIKLSDQACQNFQITMKAKDECSTSDVEIEDVSDETSASS